MTEWWATVVSSALGSRPTPIPVVEYRWMGWNSDEGGSDTHQKSTVWLERDDSYRRDRLVRLVVDDGCRLR